MRSHGRSYKRSRPHKGQDEEHYLGAQMDDMRSETYPRLHESSRHTESYRTPSHTNKLSYDTIGGPSTTGSQRHSDGWRRGDLEEERHGYIANDGYHRRSGGREDHDILDTRDPEGWSSREVRYTSSRSDWSERYDYAYPPSSYAETSSRNPLLISPHDSRNASFDPWTAEDSRIDDRHGMVAPDDRHLDRRSPNWRHQQRRDKSSLKFQSDSGWDTQRRSKAWDEPPAAWDDTSHEKDHRIISERSWDPAPGWQPSGHGGHDQGARHGHRSSTASNRNPTTNANANYKGGKRGTYSSNKPKRDWRNDDGTLNNWQKREVHPSSDRIAKPPPRRKHRRSSSRSRSPAASNHSRRSSWERSRSRSISPVPKRRRRGATPPAATSRSPSDRGRGSWVSDPHHDRGFSPYSPRSPRKSPPGYHSSRERGRTPLPPHPRHDRDLSPLTPRSPANYAGPTSSEQGRAILRPNSRYAREHTASPKRSPASYVRRQRSISPISSASSERSPSRSPPDRVRAVHRLPPMSANPSLSPPVAMRSSGTTPHKQGYQRNGKTQTNGRHNDADRRRNISSVQASRIDSMPPPNVIPRNAHLPFTREAHPPSQYCEPIQPTSYPLPRLPSAKLDPPPQMSRFAPVKNAGFKPINQTSSSLRKFFPGEDEEIENFMDDQRVRSSSVRPLEEETYDRTRPYQTSRSTPLHHERKTWPSPPPVFSPRSLDHDSSGQVAEPPASSSQIDFRQLLPEDSDLRRTVVEQTLSLPAVESLDDTTSVEVPPTPSESRGELYKIISQVGEGTFGKVYKAQNMVTRVHVALKRIRMESEKDGFPVTAMREIKLLQSLQHSNVVRLYEMMVSNGSVYMVFEYMDHDLTGVLSQTQFSFTHAHLKSLCHQMLAGLAYLHHKGVIHRDIKGSNILINNRGELKLADFGLARFYQKRRRTDYTNRVITLWYRPPELLFGATVYGPEVDMWSAGCIMLELFTKKPVFQGNDEIHQLDVVYKIIGTPTLERWTSVMDLPWYELVKPRETIPNRFRDLFQKWMSPAALDLAERLLAYDPSQRATAGQAMDAPYFTQEEPQAALPIGLAALEGEWHELETKRERAKKKKKSESAVTENHHM